MSEKTKMTLQHKLAAIQQQLKVSKGQYNSFGKYHYRSAEDILEAIKPYADFYGVTFRVTEELRSFDNMETPLIYVLSTASITCWETGQSISSVGTAFIDFEAKGMQMPQRTGSASSYAKKYSLGNLCLIDDTKDADSINDHGRAAVTAPPAPVVAPKPIMKAMTPEEKTKFLKAIGEGKFASVEKYLIKYADSSNKKVVVDALTKAKSGE